MVVEVATGDLRTIERGDGQSAGPLKPGEHV
jgi:hypothetical protein